MDNPEVIARGVRAEKILTDSVYIEAFDKVKAAILTKFETSPVRDSEGREHLFKMLKALNDSKGYLEQAMQDGKIQLHLQEEKSRFAKLFR
jgi:hypothetical protein